MDPWNDCHLFVISSLFLLFPIIIFFCNKNKTVWKCSLALLLLTNIFLSLLFWLNPIENSLFHFYDAFLAKISYILFPIYILFVKNGNYTTKLLFLILLLSTSITFYYSDKSSKKHWCSNEHLVYHSIFHFLSSIGSSIAFI